MGRIDIVGLTLAEIALVLLFCLATLIPGIRKTESGLIDLGKQVQNLKKKAAQDAQTIAHLRDENRELEGKFGASRPGLRSRATPSCSELGKAAGWLFAAVIRGRDSYEVNGDTMSLRDLLFANSEALKSAREGGCHHSIQLYYGAGVSGIDYDYALRRIEEYFYTKKMGPKQ
jgi:hypothetical protein